MWPTKFKREMAHQMNTGKLTAAEVQKVCRVPDKTAFRWRNHYANTPKHTPSPEPVADATFVEVQLAESEQDSSTNQQPILFRHGQIEVILPRDQRRVGAQGVRYQFSERLQAAKNSLQVPG